MFIQVHLVQSKSLSPFPMHRYLLCTLWILYDNAFAILLLFSLTSSNSFLFSWRHCFFLAKNKIMTRNGTFLLAKATSTATLARSPRVTIVPYMKMKQYWAKGRILVQRGDVSRGNAFFNQTGNCSSPSPFFCRVCNQNVYDPFVPINVGDRKKHLYFGHFKENMNLSFSLLVPRWLCGYQNFCFLP